MSFSSSNKPGFVKKILSILLNRWMLFLYFISGSALLGAYYYLPDYFVGKAKSWMQKDHIEEATAYAERALKIDSTRIEGMIILARSAWIQEEFSDADQWIVKIQKLDKKAKIGLFEWTLLNTATGEMKDTEPYLKNQLGQDDKKDAIIYEALCMGYLHVYRHGDLESAIKNWKKIDPGQFRIYYYEARLWQRLHRYEEAIIAYHQAMKGNPDYLPYHLGLAYCLLEIKQPQELYDHLTQLADSLQQKPMIQLYLARSCLLLNRLQEGHDRISAITGLETSPLYLLTYGELYSLLQKDDSAMEYFQRLLKLDPSNRDGIFQLIQILNRQNKTEEVKKWDKILESINLNTKRMLEICNRELPQKPDDLNLQLELADIYWKLGKIDSGLGWALLALKHNPDSQKAIDLVNKLQEAQKTLLSSAPR